MKLYSPFFHLICILTMSSFVEAQQTAQDSKAANTVKPEVVEKILVRKKINAQQIIQINCTQTTISPEYDIEIKVQHQNKKKKTVQKIYQNRTFNSCKQFKFSTVSPETIVMVAPPGLRNDEPGSTLTITYVAKDMVSGFVQKDQKTYSPFLDLKQKYEKFLANHQVSEAEKLIIKEKNKLDGGLSSQLVQSIEICEKFHKSYLQLAQKLYKEKKYKESFNTLMIMKAKFGDPQNIFYDPKSKTTKLALVCESKNSNQDLSENHFATFARVYMKNDEYIPFIIKRAFDLIKNNAAKEDIPNLLNYTAQLIRKTNLETQSLHQPSLVQAWQTWTKDNSEHPDYDRLLEADNHLVMLLAHKNKCDQIPKSTYKRMNLAVDQKDTLEGMSTGLAEDYFNQGLINSSLNEYVQYVQSRSILKKCDKIPQIVFERYFKYIGEKKVVDDTSL